MNPVVDSATWRAARREHLADEKAFTRQRDELAAQRRELPWLRVSADYTFTGEHGPATLIDLFGHSEQLLVYHFMFGPDWEDGCVSCSFWADNFDGVDVHLEHRNTRLVAVSRAPYAKLARYRQKMGWRFSWFSAHDSTFNDDMGVSFTPEQIASGEPLYNYGTMSPPGEDAPGLSVFRRDGDAVYLTYQTFGRGLDVLNGAYHFLDATSLGRNEDSLSWPMAWLQRHTDYNIESNTELDGAAT